MHKCRRCRRHKVAQQQRARAVGVGSPQLRCRASLLAAGLHLMPGVPQLLHRHSNRSMDRSAVACRLAASPHRFTHRRRPQMRVCSMQACCLPGWRPSGSVDMNNAAAFRCHACGCCCAATLFVPLDPHLQRAVGPLRGQEPGAVQHPVGPSKAGWGTVLTPYGWLARAQALTPWQGTCLGSTALRPSSHSCKRGEVWRGEAGSA